MTAPTVYHITHQKAGSQWLLGVLAACAPGRIVWPAQRMIHVTKHPIFQGMVYPTVYLTKHDFDCISQPGPFRAVVVIRDLRDTLVSLYSDYAAIRFKEKPGPFKGSMERRAIGEILQSMSETEGLRFIMHTTLRPLAWVQLSWINSGFPCFRYEDLIKDDGKVFRKILSYCEIEVSDKSLAEIVSDNSFQKKSGRSLGVEDKTSHLRKGLPGDWRNYLKGDLLDEFKELYDDALIKTGYENNRNWGRINKLFPLGKKEQKRAQEQALTTNFGNCWCGGTVKPFGERHAECTDCRTKMHRAVFNREPVAIEPSVGENPHRFSSRFAYGPFQGDEALWPITIRARHELGGDYAAKRMLGLLRFKEPGAKVLDVGCGSGSFTALMKQSGFSAVGLEAIPKTVEFARHAFGVDVIEGMFQDWQIETQSLDVISMFYTLQSMQHPLDTLKKCFELLKEDGLLIIETFDFPETFLFEELASKRPDCMSQLNLDLDLHLFSQGSLRLLLEKAGFILLEESEGITYCAKTRIPPQTDAEIDELLQKTPERRIALAVIDQYRSKQREAQQSSSRAIQMTQQLWQAQSRLSNHTKVGGSVT